MLKRPGPESTRSALTWPSNFSVEVAEQRDLALVARGEVGVAALGGHRSVVRAVPEDARHAEARPGGDERAVARLPGLALVEGVELRLLQDLDAVGGGFEVVDESDALDAERLGERRVVDFPGEVRRLDAPARDRAGDAEAGVRDGLGRAVLGDELGEDGFERAVLAARIALLDDGAAELLPVRLDQRDVGFRAPDVSGDYHFARPFSTTLKYEAPNPWPLRAGARRSPRPLRRRGRASGCPARR